MTEFAEHRVDEIVWIVDDDLWMMAVVVVAVEVSFVVDALCWLQRALQMLPFFSVRVVVVGVAAAADDTVQPLYVWPWHALLWSLFYFSHLDSDWRFRV